MIILIGDAPPNTEEEVKTRRENAANLLKNPNYWQNTKNYKNPTHWKKEIQGIKNAEVPLHTFYVLNDKIEESKKVET
jgi:hypothetical protein